MKERHSELGISDIDKAFGLMIVVLAGLTGTGVYLYASNEAQIPDIDKVVDCNIGPYQVEQALTLEEGKKFEIFGKQFIITGPGTFGLDVGEGDKDALYFQTPESVDETKEALVFRKDGIEFSLGSEQANNGDIRVNVTQECAS